MANSSLLLHWAAIPIKSGRMLNKLCLDLGRESRKSESRESDRFKIFCILLTFFRASKKYAFFICVKSRAVCHPASFVQFCL